jgi:hypothetical protein
MSTNTIINDTIINDTNINHTNINDDNAYYIGNNYLNLGNLNINNKKVNILLYTINKYTIIPYISFILQKHNNVLNSINKLILNNSTQFNIINELLNKIYFIDKIFYKGFYKYNNEIYLFYNYSKKNNIIKNFNKSSYVEVTISEIINYNKCFDYKINDKIVNLFLNNKLLNYLEYKKNILEVPEIYYKYHDDINMYNIVNDDFKLNNNYFEFHSIDSLKKNKKKYVIKYIIFTGYITITNNTITNNTITNNTINDDSINYFDSILIINSKTNTKIINVKNFNQIYLQTYYKMY